MLNKSEYNKLLDDIKIIARLLKIVRDEPDIKKREYSSLIVEDMVNRLYKDIEEMKEAV